MSEAAALPRLTREAVEDASLHWERYVHTFDGLTLRGRLVAGVPFVGNGLTAHGLAVRHAQYLYPTLFRVLACAPACRILRPGDVAWVKPHTWDDIDTDAFYCATIDERRPLFTIEGYGMESA